MRTLLAAPLVVALLLAAAGPAAAQTAAPRPAPTPAEPGWIGFWYASSGAPWVVVERVERGSPAQRAGLAAGDTVVAVNGRTPGAEGLGAMGRGLRVGDAVRLVVRRGGLQRRFAVVAAARPESLAVSLRFVTDSVQRTIMRSVDSARLAVVRGLPEPAAPAPTVVVAPTPPLPDPASGQPFHMFVAASSDALLAQLDLVRDAQRAPPLPRAAPAPPALSPWVLGADRVAGARLTPLNEGLATYFGTGEGLLVVEVAPGTPAGEAGLVPGDVLLEAAGRPLADLADLRAALARAAGRPAALQVLRRGKRFETRLP